VSVAKQQLRSRKDWRLRFPNDVLGSLDNNRRGIVLLLDVMASASADCETAFEATSCQTRLACIHSAKGSYAAALRSARHLSFDLKDVQAFEFASVKLENAISRLERQHGEHRTRMRPSHSAGREFKL
jgi:hypothetical protein